MSLSKKITLAPTEKSDFQHFTELRKSVMRPHVMQQGLPWHEDNEDAYHKALFNAPGLRRIIFEGKCIGFVGISSGTETINIGRFCVAEDYQSRGIGTHVLRTILEEPVCKGKTITIDVLKMNPSRRIFERLGFALVSEDEKLAHYERKQDIEELHHRIFKFCGFVRRNKHFP